MSIKKLTHTIADPLTWDGHEAEVLLATESGNGSSKELVVVTVIRVENAPEAFYRVKEAGEVPADFTNWLEAVDYYNCVGSSQCIKKEGIAVAKRELMDEDWKTSIAKNKAPIPAGAKMEVIGTLQNMYGDFLEVKYNETKYTVKPEDIEQR